MDETTLILFRRAMLTVKKFDFTRFNPQTPLMRKYGVPKGIRTPVPTVKGWCPRPLDDGDFNFKIHLQLLYVKKVNKTLFKPFFWWS